MSYKYQPTDLQIYKAVFANDWNSVSKTFEDHPTLRTRPINQRLETPLMIAVGTNRSHDFVRILLASLSVDALISGALAAENNEGDTALHYAAKIGNMIDAYELVSYFKNPEIALRQNIYGFTPLFYAAWHGRKKELLEFLYTLTGVLSPLESEITTQSLFHGDLLTPAIDAGFLDIALKLVDTYSKSALCYRWDSQRPLNVIASKPELFPCGGTLGSWHAFIYSLLPVNGSKIIPDQKTMGQQHAHDEEAVYTAKEFSSSAFGKCTSITEWLFNRIFKYIAPSLNSIYHSKITHKQTKELVQRLCKFVTEKGDHDIVWTILGSTISTAIESGNHEIIEECILAYPSIIWVTYDGFHLFPEAIKHRQEQVYNLIYQMSDYKAFVSSYIDKETEDNVLHIAAKLAPPHRLRTVTGAALQMQRELQWFEEVQKSVNPSQVVALNKKGKTPSMVFNEEHAKLLKQGQEWMRDTATSSSVVATLIMTVAFAAIFDEPPGGDKIEGTIGFMIFVISDAVALFSSATSALLFLGILTSRYAERDFLEVLPRRLMGGIFTLFLSLVATMIEFSATLALTLEDELQWIVPPLVIVTSIPVGMFVMIQFPLLIELFKSTYGPNIFHQQHKQMIH